MRVGARKDSRTSELGHVGARRDSRTSELGHVGARRDSRTSGSGTSGLCASGILPVCSRDDHAHFGASCVVVCVSSAG